MEGFNGIVHSDQGELQHLPLEEVSVKVLICDVTARVLLTQRYANPASFVTGRAKYVFPVPSRAAVCAFELTHADGRVIVGEAKEKTKAANEHDEALKDGRFTGLLEWATDDVFTISIGSIPARESVTTKLVYVLDLMEDEHPNQIRFQLPMAVGERYGTPPTTLSEAASPSARSCLRITADIQMAGRISSVSSPTHTLSPLIPRKTQTGRASSRRTTAVFRSGSFLRKDFVLVIEARGLDAPRCLAERDERSGRLGTIAMQLTLVPKFELPPVPAQEYLFVVDRSGSMAGERMRTAKRTLRILLRMLPNAGDGTGKKTKFNIWSFGNLADSMFAGGSREYTGATLNEATSHVDQMHADYGGTEIRSALALALGSRDTSMSTVVFVLTDGETYDIEETVNTVSKCVHSASTSAPLRVFTLGIGETVSSAMCEGIARAGNGVCLLASSTETIVGKCARLLRAGRKGVLEDVTLDWGFGSQEVIHYEQTPQQINHLDPGSRFSIFLIARLPRRSRNKVPKDVTLRARVNGASNSATIEHIIAVDLVKPFSEDSASIPLLHTMAARRLLTDYEDGRIPGPLFADVLGATGDVTGKVGVFIGEEYQLASKYTSFVAVEGAPARAQSRRELYGSQRRRSQRKSIASGSSSLGSIADAAFTVMGWVAGGLGSVFNLFGTNSEPRPRRSSRVPGAFSASNEASVSRADTISSEASRSTMSSLVSSQSDWDSSRTATPSPPPSMDEDPARSASPLLQLQPQRRKRQEPPRPPISPKVIDLVQLQAFDGSFDLSDEFGEIVGRENMARAAEFGVAEKVWATALAVAFMKKHLAREPDLLEGLLDKAMEFVGGGAGLDFDAVVALARALIV